MRFSLRLLLLLTAVVVVASMVAPFVSWGLTAAFETTHRFSFPRVYDRVLEILAVLAFIGARRWLGLTSWGALGLGQPRRRGDILLGIGIALGGMVILLAVMYWADALRFFWRYPFEKGVHKAIAGTLGAVLIGTGEELLFRGILLGGLMREMRRSTAIVWTTAVYAVVHFLRGGRQIGEVTLGSGFERLVTAFAPLADMEIVPALTGFIVLGLLLAYARLLSGGLYLSIGLHIGFVFALRVGRVVMEVPQHPGLLWGQKHPPLVSGVAGWAALLVCFGLVSLVRRKRSGALHP